MKNFYLCDIKHRRHEELITIRVPSLSRVRMFYVLKELRDSGVTYLMTVRNLFRLNFSGDKWFRYLVLSGHVVLYVTLKTPQTYRSL